MYSTLFFVACLGVAFGSPQVLLGLHNVHDDGQWRPELDGSIASQLIHDDGSWKPALDNSLAGLPQARILHGLHGLPLIHRLRRSLINANSLPVPADTLEVAWAKQASLIQQNTEATRNLIGGIPLNLPADTPEVAIGKQAHAIAHARQNALTYGGHPLAVASPIATRLAFPHPVSYTGLGLHGLGFNGWW